MDGILAAIVGIFCEIESGNEAALIKQNNTMIWQIKLSLVCGYLIKMFNFRSLSLTEIILKSTKTSDQKKGKHALSESCSPTKNALESVLLSLSLYFLIMFLNLP